MTEDTMTEPAKTPAAAAKPAPLPGFDSVTLSAAQMADAEALGLTHDQMKMSVYVALAKRAKDAGWTVEQLVAFHQTPGPKTQADIERIRGQRDHQGRTRDADGKWK